MTKIHITWPKLVKNPNSKILKSKFKGVPGTFRPPECRRWIRNPILARNGFDSPPGNTSRVLRGRLSPLPGIDISSWKEKYKLFILHPWVTSSSIWRHQYLGDVLKRSILHDRSKIPSELKIFLSLKMHSRFMNSPELPTSQMQNPPHLPDPLMIKISNSQPFHRSITV